MLRVVVVNLTVDSLTNKEITQKLHLSAAKVKSHVHNILEKNGIKSSNSVCYILPE